MAVQSPFLDLLRDRIDLKQIPFSDRGSRLMVFAADNHLLVRLAERWAKINPPLSGYLERPPLLSEWQFTDGEGHPLPMIQTTYPHRLDCQTSTGTFTLVFVDTETLLVTLPPGQCGLSFRATFDQAHIDRRGGVLRLTGDIRRNLAYTTTARVLTNQITAFDATQQTVRLTVQADGQAAFLLNITPRLGFNRWVPEPQVTLQAAAARWHAWFAAAPSVEEQYRAQYYYAWWIMRAGLISPRFYTTREAMMPSKLFYVGVWQWDAYFHALAYRHVDVQLAQDQIRVLLDHQREDGMIPDAVHDEGTVTHLTFPVDADVTKPPLAAWVAWKLYESNGDREFLDEIYEALVRCNRWWFEKNDLDGNGLCEYHHPYSSGLDNSPLWDEGVPVEAPDLNTYLCLQQEALARIAAAIGEREAARSWAKGAEALAHRMIDQLWDPAAGLFWAVRRPGGERVRARTPFSLFPLITGRMPPDIAARLVAHLTDEKQFWPSYPVPTVSLDDPAYDPLQMWRGPTWVNVNYLLVEGLQRSGYGDLACTLRRRTLAMMLGAGDIYEYYHPETGQPPPKAASTFGWSSALFIEMALQEAVCAQTEATR
jgi:putative isomerase